MPLSPSLLAASQPPAHVLKHHAYRLCPSRDAFASNPAGRRAVGNTPCACLLQRDTKPGSPINPGQHLGLTHSSSAPREPATARISK